MPALFFDPTGRIGTPGVRDTMVSAMDWLPTLLDILKIDVAAGHTLDGHSLVTVLRDVKEPSPHDALYWQLGNDPLYAPWAIRAGDWKLLGNVHETKPPADASVLNEADRNLFLANLKTDPGERRNLASQQPGKVEELLAVRVQFLRSLQHSKNEPNDP